ncbi:HAD-IA family hydrolase [Nitrogeniibacter mangrovi]|uniref:HAD-IA family hydrolase n=1 Tax=Nitrogeniibacter mangrovi TaxID=2016596 RepID=A0A6C1B186_9RHOO|nr:HAD-IA family hydrolase [Nitrogeniibacter mangrovi]QID17381.1 HAD-IA family hydrolase [Nitrogeniibacter mangrovi]
MRFKAVLFDLDGTLADTAPDLGGALNALLVERGHPERALASLRPYTSAGTRGMLRAGFGVQPGDADYADLAARFLELYAERLCVDTEVFPALVPVLDTLDTHGVPWGIVTNKPRRFTEPLVDALGLTARCACIVSGDSTDHPKPAPDSLLLAATLCDLPPADALYVGDDLRDVQAGAAAGMATVAAAWGYLGVDTPIEHWGADWTIQHPAELATICGLALATS